MNDQTVQLLRELAEKFGTTTEHLWGVLIKQAYISGVGDLITSIAFAFAAIYVFKTIKTIEFSEKADRYAVFFVYWMFVGVFSLAIILSLPLIVASFLNPEYWALHQVLK